MKLLTKEMIKRIPPYGSTEDVPLKEKTALYKFFTPWANWTWWVIEGEPEGDDYVFWGFVEGFAGEFGPFMLSELSEVKGPAGLRIERDLHFTPAKLKDIPNVNKYIYD